MSSLCDTTSLARRPEPQYSHTGPYASYFLKFCLVLRNLLADRLLTVLIGLVFKCFHWRIHNYNDDDNNNNRTNNHDNNHHKDKENHKNHNHHHQNNNNNSNRNMATIFPSCTEPPSSPSLGVSENWNLEEPELLRVEPSCGSLGTWNF